MLYQIVRDHFETFRAQAANLRDGEGLPRFVERAFEQFLRCGWLAGGFARFRCARCGLDRLVAFSCKGRALCPSCGGRRMAERAAHLVDRVLPDVPVRQWVLSLPHRLRYTLAWDHDLCRAVAGLLARAAFRLLRDRARDADIAEWPRRRHRRHSTVRRRAEPERPLPCAHPGRRVCAGCRRRARLSSGAASDDARCGGSARDDRAARRAPAPSPRARR